jgi:hypothetical protein
VFTLFRLSLQSGRGIMNPDCAKVAVQRRRCVVCRWCAHHCAHRGVLAGLAFVHGRRRKHCRAMAK